MSSEAQSACPRCGKGVDYLIYNGDEVIISKFAAGRKYLDEVHADVNSGSTEYICPNCNELFSGTRPMPRTS